MRIYDYTCKKCGHSEKDVLVRTKEDEIQRCPMCGEEMKREFPLIMIDIGLSKSPMTGYKPGPGDVRFGRL